MATSTTHFIVLPSWLLETQQIKCSISSSKHMTSPSNQYGTGHWLKIRCKLLHFCHLMTGNKNTGFRYLYDAVAPNFDAK